MKHFERMVKWGAQPKRLAESFGISEPYAYKLLQQLGEETTAKKRMRDHDEKTVKATRLLEQGGISVTEAARTVGINVSTLRGKGLRSTQDRHERVEVRETRNRALEQPPTYANGRLTALI